MSGAQTFGWAVLYPNDSSWGSPGEPLIFSVKRTREGSMQYFVDQWRTGDHDGLTVSKVWQRAYRRGWRLARVSITPAFGYGL